MESGSGLVIQDGIGGIIFFGLNCTQHINNKTIKHHHESAHTQQNKHKHHTTPETIHAEK